VHFFYVRDKIAFGIRKISIISPMIMMVGDEEAVAELDRDAVAMFREDDPVHPTPPARTTTLRRNSATWRVYGEQAATAGQHQGSACQEGNSRRG
jgi:hypothetical protein